MLGYSKKFKKSRLSWYKQEQLIEHFISGSMARCAGELLGLNPKTSTYYFHLLREIIAYDVSELKHMRINHGKEFANKQNPINGIENFWNQATSGWALHRANLIKTYTKI